MADRRILIADDKASSRELVRTILENFGYEVQEAEDGIKALEAIRSSLPDLVLLDLQMPGLTGHEVLAQLRADEQFANLPVVALTASAMAGDREKALAAGFTSYLAKPVTLSTLRTEVSRLLPPQ
jgi:two-component system, cell cycle response regulator DivK